MNSCPFSTRYLQIRSCPMYMTENLEHTKNMFCGDVLDETRIDYAAILDSVCDPGNVPGNPRSHEFRGLPRPSRHEVFEAVEMLRSVLFPGFFGRWQLTEGNIRSHVRATLDVALRKMMEQVL